MALLGSRPRRLSRRLKKETRTEHDLAEASRFAKLFFKGRFDQRGYAKGLARIEPVYAALEAGLEAHDILTPFQRPHVYRRDVIRSDRERFGADLEPVETSYAARIREIAADQPFRLLGHFYVRYFADMSGVAKVAPMAHRLLGIDAEVPLEFFRFRRIPDLRAEKNDLRRQLDAVPPAFHEAVLDEAKRSFVLHRDLVDGLLVDLEAPSSPQVASAERASAPPV
ncbi:MAG: biliverdin-producing heme oxygenase [Myxococcota bacterium]